MTAHWLANLSLFLLGAAWGWLLNDHIKEGKERDR